MEPEVKLRWSDLLNIWLWHRYPREGLVTDDLAYVAMLRVLKFVESAVAVLENPATIERNGEK